MLRKLAVASLVAAAWASPGLSDSYGPRFGANSFSTSIDTVASFEDQDDYVAVVSAGEKLTVKVSAARGSALLPALSLVSPDGIVTALTPPAVSEKSGGRVVALDAFEFPTTGRWAVRVAGKAGTQGGYTVKFKVGSAPSGKLTKQHLGGADPLVRDVAVEAIDGSLLDVAVTYPRTQATVHIGAIRDPAGGENSPGTPPVEKKGSSKLTRRPLHQGSGPYAVTLSIDAGECTYAVTTRAVPQGRPRARKAVVLSGAEPFLDVRATPARGDGGLAVRLTGLRFPTSPVPQVFFDGAAGTGVTVASDGTFLDVVAPPGAADTVVEVAVVQADGQAAVRPAYFRYVPLPTATDLTDAGGVSVLGGSTAGGAARTLVGTGFLAGHKVRFGATEATGVTVVDATHIRLVTPAHGAGLVNVTVEDEFARTATASFQFEFKVPPAFAAAPYSQAFAPTSGGTPITITGTGFEATDQLRINGAVLASTFINATTRTFTSPAVPAGVYGMELVDRFGTVVAGPAFEAKDPPGFAASPYVPAFARTAGGTTITITGSGFEPTDQLQFNGTSIASTFQNSARRQFVSPVIAAGAYAVALVDRYGVVVNGPTFEVKDAPLFANTPYSPGYGPTAGGATITISGTGFESADTLRFDGSTLTSTFVNATTRRFTSPALAPGFYSVQLIDRLGQTGAAPDFEVRAAPTISGVTATAGPILDSSRIATGGGATITVTGTRFAADTTATLGGASAPVTSQTATQLMLTAPAGTSGAATLVVSDAAGQTASSGGLTYVGFGDETANRQPGSSATDNFSASRGAIGDLDGDGSADDLVITSDDYHSIGSRYVFTRLFFGDGTALTDVTDANFPGTSSMGDVWKAQAVAIGDLDGGDSDQDILIAGSPFQYYISATYTYYRFEARLFTNDGSGTFSQSSCSPQKRTSPITCLDTYGSTYAVFQHNSGFHGSDATSLAIGDLDGDGDNDFVMATDHCRSGYAYISPGYVSFSPGSYSDANAGSHYLSYGTYYYTPGVRVFDNQGGGGFLDVTFPRLPLCGNSPSYLPAFHGREVRIGDIDGDSSPDVVVTWDDPTTTTPCGISSGSDTSRNCTAVLLNDGYGFFSDQTSSWMPAVSYPEFWQASRMELIDLDGDSLLDLVLLHDKLLDGSTTSVSSLRILQNQGAFVDVTSSAIPSVPLSGTADDNLRGTSLAVRDVDGDGNLDILVGTTEALLNASGNPVRRTRLLRGDGALHFAVANEFLPLLSVDTGESQDLLIGDIAGNTRPSLLLLTEPVPGTSPSGERLRAFDWK